MRSRASILVWTVLAVLGLLACGTPERRTGDVEEIRAAGELRVAVRPGFRTAPAIGDRGADEVILLGQLASRLGVTVRWIEAGRHDQVLPMVRNGLADIGVIRFSPASLLDEGIRGTVAVGWVEDLLVSGRELGLDSFEKVHGLTVHLHRSAITASLRSFLLEEGLTVEEVPEEVPVEEMLRRVRTGRYDLTIVDSGIAETERASRRMVIIGPVAERRALVWAVREEGSQLRLAIDRFLFAERVLSGASGLPSCRDLKQIRQTGTLRLVTRNSATTCTVERGGLEGFEYDLAVSFARSLKVRLELSIPPPDVDPMEWLELGYGDLTALHEPLSPGDAGGFLASVPYRRVDLVSVVSARAEPPAAVEDLAGMTPEEIQLREQERLLAEAELQLEQERERGLVAEEEPTVAEGGRLSPMAMLNPVLDVFRNITPVKVVYTDQNSSSYARLLQEAPFWYLTGLVPELDVADSLYSAYGLDNRKNLTLSSSTKITKGIGLDLKFGDARSERDQIGSVTRNYKQDWPDAQLTLSGIEKWRIFGGNPQDVDSGWFRSSNFNVSYKRTKTVNNITERSYNPNITTALSPRWTFNLHSGMTATLTANFNSSESITNGVSTLNDKMRLGLQIRHSFNAQSFLAKMGLYRPGSSQSVTMDVDISYQTDRNERINPGLPAAKPTGTDRISVNPRFSYQITKNLSGALRFIFGRSKNIASGQTSTTLGLGLEATFVF